MWNVTDWQKVVFSVESRLVLETEDNLVRLWRRPGPFLNGLPGAIFQQDNARPHAARVAQDFLCHFQSLPWPALSPELSEIPSCHSVYDLELAVQDLWTHLPQDNLRSARLCCTFPLITVNKGTILNGSMSNVSSSKIPCLSDIVESYEKAEDLLLSYASMRLMLRSHPVQLLIFFCDLADLPGDSST
ncbi:transposable element Tcb2 transposase [Trichonephila clavipes]|nr:transposable element Tcb2 transposase [Trichonephila clavipes]